MHTLAILALTGLFFFFITTRERKFPSSSFLDILKWNIVSSPKDKGGLGIQKLEQKNKALLAGLAWRIFQSPQAMWSRILINKYLHKRNVTNNSHTWDNILKGWQHCQLGLQWRIGEGKHISVWNDPWLRPGTTLRSMIHGPLTLDQNNLTVSQLLRTTGWNTGLINFDLGQSITRMINATYVSQMKNHGYCIYWGFNAKEKFHCAFYV